MGWEVPVLAGMEIDGYDALEPHYMVIRDDNATPSVAAWRMMPTEGPYMLKDTFPEPCCTAPRPLRKKRVWELSRFAIETEGDSQASALPSAPWQRCAASSTFADEATASDKYVTVTTTAIERLLRHTGVETTRMGPPLQVGVERAVALEIHLGEKTRKALFGTVH